MTPLTGGTLTVATVGDGDALALRLGDGELGDGELAAEVAPAEADGVGTGCPRRASHSPSPMRVSRTTIATMIRMGAHQVRGCAAGTHCASGGSGAPGRAGGTPARPDQRAAPGWVAPAPGTAAPG
jgi:hypothetical protein